ncbi:MAG: hypothetical protein NC311_13555 [Muribaculaceae bacterium]|nr:hypothetical protein [Muribaculaceae bacterium]
MLEPGYRRFRAAPELYGKLLSASAEFQSPRGEIRVSWEVDVEKNEAVVRLKVPFDTTAVLALPDGQGEKEYPSGQWEVKVLLDKPHLLGYSLDWPLDILEQCGDTAGIIRPLTALLDRLPADMKPDRQRTVREILDGMMPSVKAMLCSRVNLAEIEEQLRQTKQKIRS